MTDFLLFVVVLGTLIIVHELGHFLAARLTGVRVEEFGIGFPPRIKTLFEAGGTKFTLNLIPLGGFVRPAGEDDPSVPEGLAAASKRVRSLVLLAGPIFNVLLGFLAFVAAFKFAAPDLQKVIITEVVPGSPAQEAGILEGDLVLSVNQETITGFESMLREIQSNLGEPVEVELQRGQSTVSVQVIPRPDPPEDEGPIGVILGHPAKPSTWPEAIRLGWRSIRLQVRAILGLPSRLIRGVATPQETRVSGLKGIHDMLSWATSIDRNSDRPFLTLNFIGVISVGLAIANLLPFPALDGGRLLFVLIEAVLGRRIAPRYEGLAHAIGFAILIVLMLYINIQDFVNPINLPP